MLSRPTSLTRCESQPDLEYLIHPRSKGTLDSLLTLSALEPTFSLIDATLAYPDVPPASYPHLHHSFHTAFVSATSTPTVHIHLRHFSSADIPFETQSAEGRSPDPVAFDAWLRLRWREKDKMLRRFREETGTLSEAGEEGKEETLVLRGGVRARDALALASIVGFWYGAGQLVIWAVAWTFA